MELLLLLGLGTVVLVKARSAPTKATLRGNIPDVSAKLGTGTVVRTRVAAPSGVQAHLIQPGGARASGTGQRIDSTVERAGASAGGAIGGYLGGKYGEAAGEYLGGKVGDYVGDKAEDVYDEVASWFS